MVLLAEQPSILGPLLARLGWSQRELGRRLGCHEATIRRWDTTPPRQVVAWLEALVAAIEALPPPRGGWDQRRYFSEDASAVNEDTK